MQWVPCHFQGQSVCTTHPHLAQRLEKEYSYTSTPLFALMACYRMHYTCTVGWFMKQRFWNRRIVVFSCRRYGTKCGGCSQGISPSDLVRKARDKVFHLNCFTCMVCRKQLSTGEELYVLDDNKFICKEDYISGKTHQGNVVSTDVLQFSTEPNLRQELTLFWIIETVLVWSCPEQCCVSSG